jgi:hypothetical protein
MSEKETSSVYERAMAQVKKNLKDVGKQTEADALDK